MALTIEERRKSALNRKSDVISARVVANYGDPGLVEDYHFDVLSRFVFVMIESWNRVPTENGTLMIIPVLRPKNLWISAEGTSTTTSAQRRADASGNISLGVAGSFSIAGIPGIDRPYLLGEEIKIKKLSTPEVYSAGIGASNFDEWETANQKYGEWHRQGTYTPFFQNSTDNLNGVKQKAIIHKTFKTYSPFLSKSHYAAFALFMATGNSSLQNYLTNLFNETSPRDAIFSAMGGFLFKNLAPSSGLEFQSIHYEDLNVDNKQRASQNDCVPLVVTTPNAFPTPKTRAVGTIAYSPSYSSVGT